MLVVNPGVLNAWISDQLCNMDGQVLLCGIARSLWWPLHHLYSCEDWIEFSTAVGLVVLPCIWKNVEGRRLRAARSHTQKVDCGAPKVHGAHVQGKLLAADGGRQSAVMTGRVSLAIDAILH